MVPSENVATLLAARPGGKRTHPLQEIRGSSVRASTEKIFDALAATVIDDMKSGQRPAQVANAQTLRAEGG
jgi:hypothetical protein